MPSSKPRIRTPKLKPPPNPEPTITAATTESVTTLSLADVLRSLGLEHAAQSLDTALQQAITRNDSPSSLLDSLMRDQLRTHLEDRARASIKRSAIFPLTTLDTYDFFSDEDVYDICKQAKVYYIRLPKGTCPLPHWSLATRSRWRSLLATYISGDDQHDENRLRRRRRLLAIAADHYEQLLLLMEPVSKPGFLEEVAPKGPSVARAHPARNLRQLDSFAR